MIQLRFMLRCLDIFMRSIVYPKYRGCKITHRALVDSCALCTHSSQTFLRVLELHVIHVLRCVHASMVCNFYDDCSDNTDENSCGTCDFERDYCGWTSPEDYRLWARFRGSTFTNGTGPDTDHTTSKPEGGDL